MSATKEARSSTIGSIRCVGGPLSGRYVAFVGPHMLYEQPRKITITSGLDENLPPMPHFRFDHYYAERTFFGEKIYRWSYRDK